MNEVGQVGMGNVTEALLEEIQRLKAKNEKLIAALEFYADKLNWQHGIAYSQNNLMNESDLYCEMGDYFYAGKKARNALKESK